MKEKQKQLFIIIGVGVLVLIILLFIIFGKKDNKDNNNIPIIDNTEQIVTEDIKKDNEKGIVLTNLNAHFKKGVSEKTKEFKYEFNLNNERVTLIFDDAILNNSEKTSKLTMYMNNQKIDVMEIIKKTVVKEPTSIIPKFYILGDKSDEVLLLEVIGIDEDIPYNVYIAINNNGEVRNSFGGYDNEKISDDEFLKAIKQGKLIYDHKISPQDNKLYCICEDLKQGKGLNKVISEKLTFSVLEASLRIDSNDVYECKSYCK